MTRLFEIKECKHCSQVLLTRFSDGSNPNDSTVELTALHSYDADEHEPKWETFQKVNVVFPCPIMAERFITDYSETSANEFANQFAPF